MSSTRFSMTHDMQRCVGCHACVLACKAENNLDRHGFRDWIVTETRGRYPHLAQEIRSERCNHCSTTPCVACCPTGASHVAPDGTVLVSHNKCTGCKACLAACPYQARYIHHEGYADKCTFCHHRVSRGDEPACVSACPTTALHFGDANNEGSPVSRQLHKRQYKTLQPEQGLGPNMFFLVKE